jgi:endonuclease/exonuclease/phosphatase family metal-dependent hydrolase
MNKLLILCLSLLAASATADDVALRVMSFNVRYGSAADGANHWEKRRALAVEAIRRFDADLLGTQETEGAQGAYLGEQLPWYTRFGVGRDDGKTKGESATLYFKTDRFEKLAGGHFWLSETPDTPGRKGWDAAYPRLVTWVKLRDRQTTGQTLVWVNTHLDNSGKQARVESAKMIKRWLGEHAKNLPVIVTADFNCTEDSLPYRLLAGADGDSLKLRDTYRLVHPSRQGDEATYHAFTGKRQGSRIDWILCSPDFTPVAAQIDHTSEEGRYPSDHFPVTATLKFRTIP